MGKNEKEIGDEIRREVEKEKARLIQLERQARAQQRREKEALKKLNNRRKYMIGETFMEIFPNYFGCDDADFFSAPKDERRSVEDFLGEFALLKKTQ